MTYYGPPIADIYNILDPKTLVLITHRVNPVCESGFVENPDSQTRFTSHDIQRTCLIHTLCIMVIGHEIAHKSRLANKVYEF